MTAITCFKPPGVALTRSGAQLAGGLVYTYSTGTTTAKASYPTYADALAGTNANANPVQLDTQGNAQIWLSGGYKIVVGTNAGTPSVPVLGVTIETYDNYPGTDATSASGNPPNFIDGLAVAIDTGDTSHDVNVAAGEARDGADGYDLTLAAALIKQVDAAWAVGTNQGGLDTGSVSNSTLYYIWLIARSDTGVVDVLISLSATAPTMPANYDKKRLVGVAKYGTGAWSQVSAINRPWQEFAGLWPDTGVANAYIITPYPVIAIYSGGLRFAFVAKFGNTGASTLNVNGLGTKAVQRNGVALSGNEIVAGQTVNAMYDAAAGAFQIISPWQELGVDLYCGTSAGTDTITATAAPAIGAYVVGQQFSFKAGGTNTGAATLNLNSVGAGAVQKNGAALVAGDITAGDIVVVVVSATTPVFQVVSPARTPVLTAASIPVSKLSNYTAANLTDVAALTASFVPNADNAINLGSASKSWAAAYLTALYVKNQALQSFAVSITNPGATLKHAVAASGETGTLGNFSSAISGASATAATTPTGTDSSTAFVSGAKKSSAATSTLIFNTASQTVVDGIFKNGNAWYDDDGAIYNYRWEFVSFNVNGVTRNYLTCTLYNSTTAATIAWGTAPASGKQVVFDFYGHLA